MMTIINSGQKGLVDEDEVFNRNVWRIHFGEKPKEKEGDLCQIYNNIAGRV